MSLVGMELNASRAVALSGPAGSPPRPFALDGAHAELPLAVGLEGRHPEAGRAGLEICRRLPHLACIDFLPHLGSGRQWKAGRHRLSAEDALALVFERLRPACAGAEAAALTVPIYLGRPQVEQMTALAESAPRRGRPPLPPVLGSLTAPLAAAQAAHAQEPWNGVALVADVDDHAFTWTAVAAGEQQANVLGDQILPPLSLRAWKGRLLDAVAERCVRHSRRDPRDSGAAEQMLYDQLDGALASGRVGRMSELVIQTDRWYQNLILRPEEMTGFCAPLVRQAVEGLEALLATVASHGPARVVLLTDAAGALPGLADALRDYVGDKAPVTALAPEALAWAAHDLVVRIHQSGLRPHDHLDATVPLVPGQSPPPRPYQRVIPIWAADR